jgi:hypothetical protein
MMVSISLFCLVRARVEHDPFQCPEQRRRRRRRLRLEGRAWNLEHFANVLASGQSWVRSHTPLPRHFGLLREQLWRAWVLQTGLLLPKNGQPT